MRMRGDRPGSPRGTLQALARRIRRIAGYVAERTASDRSSTASFAASLAPAGISLCAFAADGSHRLLRRDVHFDQDGRDVAAMKAIGGGDARLRAAGKPRP
jgi:hypothetical protein